MNKWIKASSFDFLKNSKYTIFVSAIVLIVGTFFLTYDRAKVLGMDFTGGYALTVNLEQESGVNYRELVEKALVKAGVSAQDFQIRELDPSNHLRLFLSKNIGPTTLETSEYTTNPRIVWVINALNEADLKLAPGALQLAEKSWSEVSGQMSSSMRNSAVFGLGLALLAILVYITIRFEFKYAISATICIVHDVLFALAAIAILYTCGVPVQIDMHTVAALMTIIGYSLNDTIIVFDRVREDVRLKRNQSFREVINHALNTTLSRTLMTSITTFLVLVPLVVLGGSTVFGFSLVMAIGVIFGTLSSLFVASPLIQYFHNRELRKVEKPSLTHNNQR